MKKMTIATIADAVHGSLAGNAAVEISGVQFLHEALPGQLTFIGSEKYVQAWTESKASAALVSEGLAVDPGAERAVVFVADADLAMATVLNLFAREPASSTVGIHPTAVVDSTAILGDGVAVGPHCYIGPHAQIGSGSVLYANVCVFDGARVGCNTVLWSGVVIREHCEVGSDCIFHPNVSIGADGFGYRPSADGRGLTKITHIGWVRIGNQVEIGANSTVDRGKFGATIVGDMTKLDNLVQIGHNVRIGCCCVLAAQVGVGGSATLGDGVVVGGQVAVSDHAVVGSHVKIGGRSGVMQNIDDGAMVLGLPARPLKETLRIWAAEGKLPDMQRRLKKLERSSSESD